MATTKQITFGTIAALATATGIVWISSSTPTYIFQGTMGPCDAGICALSGVVTSATKASDAAVPADSGVKPDAAMMPDATMAPDATSPFPDAAPANPDAAVPTSDGGLPGLGLYEPPGSGGKVYQVAALTEPPAMTAVVDPTFGVSALRLLVNYSHDYSQLQAFSGDNAYLLLIDQTAGVYWVYTWPGMVKKWQLMPTSMTSPRWVPNSHKLLGFGGPQPVTLDTFDADSGTVTTVYTYPNEPYFVGAIVQEEMSEDGRWTIAYTHGGSDNRRHLTAVDITTGLPGADVTVEGLFKANGGICTPDPQYGMIEPNWVGVDPKGLYMLFGWARDGDATVPCSGLELYDIHTGAFVRHVYNGHGHGDSGTDATGREFWLSTEDSTSNLMQFWYDGSGTTRLRAMDWGSVGHISCRGPRNWCIISGYALGGDMYAGYQEVYLISTADGSLQRIYQHRSSSCQYWTEPKTTASKDGHWAIFDTDWGTCSAGPSPFVIDLTQSGVASKPKLIRVPAHKFPKLGKLSKTKQDLIEKMMRRPKHP